MLVLFLSTIRHRFNSFCIVSLSYSVFHACKDTFIIVCLFCLFVFFKSRHARLDNGHWNIHLVLLHDKFLVFFLFFFSLYTYLTCHVCGLQCDVQIWYNTAWWVGFFFQILSGIPNIWYLFFTHSKSLDSLGKADADKI